MGSARSLLAWLMMTALILSLSLLPFAGVPAAAEGEGSSPDNPIDLGGTMSGTLGPGEHTWYRFYSAGLARPGGVLMTMAPVPAGDPTLTGFQVGYLQKGTFGSEWAVMGSGTMLGTNPGVKYWRGQVDGDHTYLVKVENQTYETVNYAVAYTGGAFPPPPIAFNAEGKQPSYGTWPELPATPTPTTEGGGTSVDNAVAISGDFAQGALGSRGRSWVSFRTFGRGRNTTVKFKFDPYWENTQDQTFFKVWRYDPTPAGRVLVEVGRGTRGGNPPDVKSWRGGGDKEQVYFLELINETSGDVRWEIKLDSFYPYWK